MISYQSRARKVEVDMYWEYSLDRVNELLEKCGEEKIIEVLQNAIESYKKDENDLRALVMIAVICTYNDHCYEDEGLSFYTSQMIETIMEENFKPDILTESIIGWKKAYIVLNYGHDVVAKEDVLVKLEIPVGTKVARSIFSNKCRAEMVKVLGITSLNKKKRYLSAFSYYNGTQYHVNKIRFPDRFDPRPWHTCSNGIHFFESEEEAIEYNFV